MIYMNLKLLYITFIDFSKSTCSGSSVRPKKMLDAFIEMGVDVKLISGQTNDRGQRRAAVREANDYLERIVPDACYIEPPSGPFFYGGDIKLVKRIHRMGIPIGLFYRDAYWMFPEYSFETKPTHKELLKSALIRMIQKRQLETFINTVDIGFFPSKEMSNFFPFKRREELPPGCFIPDGNFDHSLSQPVEFFFVGGAAINHGTYLTIQAFEIANSDKLRAALTYVCPKAQWDKLGIDAEKYKDWLTLIHAAGDENLKPLYKKADVAILIAPRTFYRDFAMPVKIFEYMSYLKPMLVTDCTATAGIVNDNHVGWVTEAKPEAVAEKIIELCEHPEEIGRVKAYLEGARDGNLWNIRAKKMINLLMKNRTDRILPNDG